jgi:hypothetical protein
MDASQSLALLSEGDYMSQRWPACFAVAGFSTAGIASLLLLGKCAFLLSAGAAHPGLPVPLRESVTAVAQRPAAPAPMPQQVPAAAAAPDRAYDQLRSRLRWVQTRIGNATLLTLDLRSRMLLAKSAAKRAQLQEVGLSFMDVYGLINAETSWVPRAGASKDGTPNLGIAQFEPATARALGVRDPNDPVEAVHAAALHMKQAALWSAERLQGLRLAAPERAEKLREGVSIYYNLSTRGRAAWNGRNTRQLPVETQRHIANARLGAQEAAVLDAQLQAASFDRPGQAVRIADLGASGG